jgi:hypothetical protein
VGIISKTNVIVEEEEEETVRLFRFSLGLGSVRYTPHEGALKKGDGVWRRRRRRRKMRQRFL